MIVFVTIAEDVTGTPLPQRVWVDLLNHMDVYYLQYAQTRFGFWYSAPDYSTRSGAWHFAPWPHLIDTVKEKLAKLAERYKVSVVWTESLRQELLTVDQSSDGNTAVGEQEEDQHVEEQDTAGDNARQHPGAGVVNLGTRE